ncbi:hypothetical protein OG713_34650 [Streptomyces sp. NBC_00723]|uniref:hypothetical protein n=1 Tax=Streptomyces sp. NBC_00723 TaxID=2903673 RepID=UPI003864769E
MSIQDDYDGRDIFDALADDFETARLRRERLRDKRGPQLGGDMTIEALPTVYLGTTFRSALEASWAATLNSLGVVWEYEPEMVTLPSGARYLPDFRLPEIGAWLEVKGTGVPRVEKAFEFGQSLVCDCPRIRGIRRCFCRWPGGELVLIGNPPRPLEPWTDGYEDCNPYAMHRLMRHHPGFVSWKSTRNNRCWLTRCTACRKTTWFDMPRCRACGGPLAGSVGHHSGSSEFKFIRISGVAITDDEPDASTHPA